MRTGLGVVGGAVVAGGVLWVILSGSGSPPEHDRAPSSSVAPSGVARAPSGPEASSGAGADGGLAGGSSAGADAALVALGAQLYKQHICISCHSDDGSTRTGPSFAGIYGHEQELTNGTKVRVNDDYIRESLVNPGAKVARGFLPTMPSYKGRLSDREVDALIAYIKSLR